MPKSARPRRAFVQFLLLSLFGFWLETGISQTVINFQAEDGWTIYGTLHLPENASPTEPVPGAVLLAEPEWHVRETFDSAHMARDLAQNGVAALTIDFRGQGESLGEEEFTAFSPEDLDKLQLDIKGAVNFLASQRVVDDLRIGIIGVGLGVKYAVREATQNQAVRVLMLISGQLDESALHYIKSRNDVPILFIVGKNDKESLREMSLGYSYATNPNSDLVLGIGHGTTLFSRTPGQEKQVVQWMTGNLKALGRKTEVSFKSSDGWTLHGTLHLPQGGGNSKVPGVVLVHGAHHDRRTYNELVQAIVTRGIATLAFDWRGMGKSTENGRVGVDLPLQTDERNKIYLDTKAAVNFLASQDRVDADRIGLVGATLATNHVLQAAMGDTRVKGIVILTQYVPTDEAKQFLATSETPVFFIASSEDVNFEVGSLAGFTKQAYQLSKSKGSQLLYYTDAGRGSDILKNRGELKPIIVQWFLEQLASHGSQVTK